MSVSLGANAATSSSKPTTSVAPVKIVIRLPGFVDEASFFNALASDHDRATVRAAPYFAFVRGKPTSKSLAKRASLCWIAFADRRAATVFAHSNSASLVFREPESGKPLAAQFDLALVQRLPPADAPAFVPQSFVGDPDFLTFRGIYEDDGQYPLLDGVITTELAAALALDVNRASQPVATAAIAAARATAVAPAPQSALVLELLARGRTKTSKKSKKKKNNSINNIMNDNNDND
jgi:hypothetical protein